MAIADLLAAPPVSLAAFAAAANCSPIAASHRLRAHGWHRVGVLDGRGQDDSLYAPRGLPVAVPEANKPNTHLRCLLWDVLAAADGPRQAAVLARDAAVPRALADKLLTAWIRAGLVVATSHRPARYRLTPDTDSAIMPPTTSTERTAHDRIWAAIRVLRRFDVPTLMTIAETSRRWTTTYVGQLQRAGYLRVHRPGVRSAGVCPIYQLARDTGRVTPRLPERSVPASADGGVG